LSTSAPHPPHSLKLEQYTCQGYLFSGWAKFEPNARNIATFGSNYGENRGLYRYRTQVLGT